MYQIHVDKEPFSIYGSYLSFGHADSTHYEPDSLFLRSAHNRDNSFGIYRVILERDGQTLSYTESAVPGKLTLAAEDASCEVTYRDRDTLLIRTKNCTLRLSAAHPPKYQLAYPVCESVYEINASAHKHRVTALRGDVRVESSWGEISSENLEIYFSSTNGEGLFALEEYANVRPMQDFSENFDNCAMQRAKEYLNFLDKFPTLQLQYAEARERAVYVLWASTVAPKDRLRRDTVLMSKNWMINIWSWDHMFNAFALAPTHPELAWAQVMTPFDHQDEFGSLPDMVGDMNVIRSFVKPPIHGMMLRWIEQQTPGFLTQERLNEIYQPLCRWTNWWFTHRDFDGDGIPQYNHGNDSGWDNATPFSLSPTLEGVDLSGFLVIQLDVLADFAARLGKVEESAEFKRRSEELYSRMIDHFLRDGRLRSCVNGTHAYADGDSLFDMRPLVLGKKLPSELSGAIVAALSDETRFLTPFGFATESIASPFYQPDGYWRGPIWAPEMLFMTMALESLEESALAREAARRFIDCCAAHGMAENFEALHGNGLRDCAYTWTASVFLFLASKYFAA